MPRNLVVFLILCELTLSAIYGSQKLDSHKLPTVLVVKVKRKPRNFKAFCVDHCILLLQHLFTHMHFITNGYKMLFKDQLVRSKATCSCKVETLRGCCGCADTCKNIKLKFWWLSHRDVGSNPGCDTCVLGQDTWPLLLSDQG